MELCALVVDAGRRTGRWSEALQAARRRVELDPLDEVGYRDLIRVHAEMGDRAGAVSTYHHCASVLHQELGIEPDPATRKLLADLVDRPAAPQERPDTRTVVASVDFVGRRDELGRLSSTMTEAFAGSLRATLVVGEPGVGKSRLVAEAARVARQRDAVVALAHCYGTPGRLALAPVAEWLGHPTLAAAVGTLAPPWRAEVERLVPTSDPAARPEGSRGVVDAWQRHRFFQGLAQALRATSRPLLLVLENLQWCDEETLDFLSFLVGTESRAPVMIALTGRISELAEERGHGDWVRRMRAAGVLDEIELTPFGSEQTAELVRLLAGADVPDDVVQLLGSATGGFPLFVVEAARHGGGQALTDAATDLDDVLRARFDQLGATARQVAGLAAATGRDFDLELLCEAADLSPDAVVHAVDELWRLRILRELRQGYDFSHDLLRATAYHLVSPPGRWLLHRRLAQSLEILYAGRTDEVAAQLADQYARAGNAARALEHYHQAAEVAARVFAHAEAIRLHHAALEQLSGLPAGADRDRLEVRTLTSMAASLNALRGYSDAELEATLERTVTLAERLSQRATLGDALVALWSSRFVQGDISGAHRLALRGVDLADTAPDGPDEALIGQVHFALAGSSLSLGMPATAVRHFEITSAHSTDEQSLSIGSHPAIHARAWSAHAYWLLGESATAAANAHEADRPRPRRGAPLQPGHRAGLRLGHLAAARGAGAPRAEHRRARRAQHPPRLRVLPRVGPRPRRLGPRRRPRHRPHGAGPRPPAGGASVLADAVLAEPARPAQRAGTRPGRPRQRRGVRPGPRRPLVAARGAAAAGRPPHRRERGERPPRGPRDGRPAGQRPPRRTLPARPRRAANACRTAAFLTSR